MSNPVKHVRQPVGSGAGAPSARPSLPTRTRGARPVFFGLAPPRVEAPRQDEPKLFDALVEAVAERVLLELQPSMRRFEAEVRLALADFALSNYRRKS